MEKPRFGSFWVRTKIWVDKDYQTHSSVCLCRLDSGYTKLFADPMASPPHRENLQVYVFIVEEILSGQGKILQRFDVREDEFPVHNNPNPNRRDETDIITYKPYEPDDTD